MGEIALRLDAPARARCTGQTCWLATLNGEPNDCPVHGDDADQADVTIYPPAEQAS